MSETVRKPASPYWHAALASEVVRLLETDPEIGLEPEEARRRLARVGPNRVGDQPETPLWRLALDQFRSLVVLLLLAAAAIAWLLGERLESIAILAALVLNAAIGFGSEWRARRSLARLRSLSVAHALVRRGGRTVGLPAEELVPGDIVILSAGTRVPADLRLIRATALRVSEAALTGESVPVEKDASASLAHETPLADRSTMAYLGTVTVAGSGIGMVTATGVATELGRIGQWVALAGERATPLERQMEQLGRRLMGLALAICALVGIAGILHGEPIGLMLETAISLAVAAIPEGLPAVTAVALAAGLWRLARAGALVRRLPAVEALGATTVICADKTGTMTENRMTATRLYVDGRVVAVRDGGSSKGASTAPSEPPPGTDSAGGAGARTRLLQRDGGGPQGTFVVDGAPIAPLDDAALARLLMVASLVNDASVDVDLDGFRLHGDPTEAALLVAAVQAGLDPPALARAWPRRREIPFDPQTRLMATFHQAPDGREVLCVKGAPGVIVERSSWRETAGGVVALTDGDRARLLDANRALADTGFRVLAVAWRPDGAGPGDRIAGLTFLGLVGFEDPLRPGVKDAIARCRAAGIRTIMLTGDQRLTAEAIGRELGLPPEAIRSRVGPEEKLALVEALQADGEVVAMTGDGVNDAPALARADIGVAMGRAGTDVAREAADLVLTDDNFATIARAVEEGRVIHANLRKVIHFLFSCNLSEIATIFVAILAGFPTPLLPLQILWVNLVTDILPAMALVRDPAEPDIMRRRPRDPEEALLTWRFSRRALAESMLLAAGALTAYFWGVWLEGPRARATTLAFVAVVLIHPFQAMHCRSDRLRWWRLPPNRLHWVSLVALLAVEWLAVSWTPLSQLLGTVSLTMADWVVVAVAVLWPAIVMEAVKGWGSEAAVGRSHPISAPPIARRQGEITRNR